LVKINGLVPDRGDIIKLQFNPQTGREQAGYRPAIVISTSEYNRISKLIVVCPITSRKKGWPFEVDLSAQMQIIGVVLVDQIKSLDCESRGAVFVEKASSEVMDEVLAKLEALVT
jgi:mRNA interferase MazF